MKCTELIIEDHAILRRALDILDGMVTMMEGGLRIEIADVAAILKFLRLFGGEVHQSMEETILFPALLRAAPDDSPIHQMLSVHAEERALVAGIEGALKFKKAADFIWASRRLSLLLRNHFNEEDTILSDLAERLFSSEEDNAVAAELEKRAMQGDIHANVSRMEWKYMPQPQGGELARAQAARL
ncbi:MAG TPA: hemerythrin domain-containing protein [Terriglobia bacterium]|nr:hemerythrin domain-containing protein [Terriglobia bacterium]